MRDTQELVPKLTFTLDGRAAGTTAVPLGTPIDTRDFAGGDLAVVLHDRAGGSWPTDSELDIRLVNVMRSRDAPTLCMPGAGAVPPSRVVFRSSTSVGSLLRCGLSEYSAVGPLVQPVLFWRQGATATAASFATLSVQLTRTEPQPIVPYMLPGLRAWFRGDVFAINSSAGFSSWTDLSGNSMNASGGSPILMANALYGRPGLQFNGNAVIATPSLSLSTYTIFTVFRATAPNALVYEHGIANGTNGCYLYTHNNATIDTTRSSVSSARVWNPNWGIDGADRITRHEFGGTHASHDLYVNGVKLGLASAVSGDPGTAATPAMQFFIGGRTGTVLPLTGYLMEVAIFSPQLPSLDALRLERRYFGGRYGIAVL